MDAINGDSFERSICSRQMLEAADRLDEQDAEIQRITEENEEPAPALAEAARPLTERGRYLADRIAEVGAECAELRKQRDEWRRMAEKAIKAAEAFQQLNLCYRVGHSPSEKLFSELTVAGQTLADFQTMKKASHDQA